MAAKDSLLADPRRRNLAVMGGAALVAILLALFALYEQAAQVAPRNARSEFFPGLAAQVSQGHVARIHIASKKGGTFDVVFTPVKTWVVPQRNDYPASYAEVNKTLVTLAALQTIEPKTARAEWLHTIGLDSPAKGGDGTEITLSDDHGHELAHLIVGKSEDIGDPNGAVGLFVRKPDETQSWLVRSEAEFHNTVGEWIDKSLMDVDQGKIQSTSVDEPGGTSYEVHRDAAADVHFKLSPVPAGREIGSDEGPDGVGNAVIGFTFDDVKPAKDIDFTNPVRVTTKTFDGLSIAIDTVHAGADYWAKIDAQSLSNSPAVAKQARNINARAAGWAYKLEDDKGAVFTGTLESLLKPKGAAAPATPDPEP